MADQGNLEAVIRKVGVIAHDFNNLLTAINGYADLAHSQLAPENPAYAFLDEVLKAGAKASTLTQDLLTLSRPYAEATLPGGPSR